MSTQPESLAGSEAERVEETLAVAGLNAPAEILIDPWGIPHLRAADEDDLFYLQGFNAARDRLWQIDLWRKRGLGRLAAHFGSGYLAQDQASRAFLYRGDMEREWLSYAPDTKAICEAFVKGVNAYIDLTERGPERLPIEFGLTATKPERWQAEDVVRIRTHALTRNALSEVLRAIVTSKAGTDNDLLRMNLEPRVTPGNPSGVALDEIPLAALDLFKLATADVTFSEARLSASLAEAPRWRVVNDLAEVTLAAEATGSNNWVVAEGRSATGRPVFAGDPHRNHSIPSLRYLVHLTAPGLDVIGAGEPSSPGVSMGHNGFAAFSQTIFRADQEDVYVYEIEPGRPDRYEFDGEQLPFLLVKERFEVKGAPDQFHVLKFTRHGPVLHVDAARNRAYALRSVWFEPGTGAYLGSLSTMRSRSWSLFRENLRRFSAPSLNHLYADVTGAIGWQPAGMIPVRRNWDGLLPVPGDGRFEWEGFLNLDDLPNKANPAEGFLATANEFNLPPDFDQDKTRIGYEWFEKSRAIRIHEALGHDARHTVAASLALQTDVFSRAALRLQRLLIRIERADDPVFTDARSLLIEWDNRLSAESAAAALSELWFGKHLKPGLFALFVPDAGRRALLAPGDVEGVLSALERPDGRFGADPAAARDALMARTLAAAWRDAQERLGADPTKWRWGQLHRGYFEHPLSRIAGGDLARQLDVGPLPKGGGASTVMYANYRPRDFRVVNGASVRFVLDVGEWDQSFCVNAPGQSGDSRSPHYGDLAPKWAKGEYVPFLYSRPAVDAAARRRIVLTPARRDS
jgi:penicillin G amidase